MLSIPNIKSFTLPALPGLFGSAPTSISEGLTVSVKKTSVKYGSSLGEDHRCQSNASH